jgi:SAM-dependent methyltransferase
MAEHRGTPDQHGHHGPTLDFGEMTERLARGAEADREWNTAEAALLVRPGDRVAVDVGCGAAGMARACAAAGAPRVIAADGNAEVLRAAAALTDDRRLMFLHAELPDGLLALADAVGGVNPGGADVIWSAAAIHHVGDQQAAIDGLAALLAPGGRLAIAEGGLSPRYLPTDLGVGQYGLEDRLIAAHQTWFDRMRAELPGSVRMPYSWAEALRRASLSDVITRTTVLERPVPLSDDDRAEVLQMIGLRVEQNTDAGTLSDDDAAAWGRLLDPADDAWLGARSDLASLRAYSVHVGVR